MQRVAGDQTLLCASLPPPPPSINLIRSHPPFLSPPPPQGDIQSISTDH